MIRAIPTINTTRLTLRPMRAPDFDAFAALRRADGPVADSVLWAAFLTVPGHWEMTGFGLWAITDRASDRVIGEAGFQDLRPGLGGDFDAFPQALCTVLPDMRGRGIAHEAATAAHDWFDRIVTGPVVARIGEGNAAALGLAQALNYRPVRAGRRDRALPVAAPHGAARAILTAPCSCMLVPLFIAADGRDRDIPPVDRAQGVRARTPRLQGVLRDDDLSDHRA